MLAVLLLISGCLVAAMAGTVRGQERNDIARIRKAVEKAETLAPKEMN